jgi:hypothetical protein
MQFLRLKGVCVPASNDKLHTFIFQYQIKL